MHLTHLLSSLAVTSMLLQFNADISATIHAKDTVIGHLEAELRAAQSSLSIKENKWKKKLKKMQASMFEIIQVIIETTDQRSLCNDSGRKNDTPVQSYRLPGTVHIHNQQLFVLVARRILWRKQRWKTKWPPCASNFVTLRCLVAKSKTHNQTIRMWMTMRRMVSEWRINFEWLTVINP